MIMGELPQQTDVLIIGGGSGGYAAAFRAADLGLGVTLVDINDRPGGVCLFHGCIPSKTLLHLAELIFDSRQAAHMGVSFEEPGIDLQTLRKWKDRVIDRLANGLLALCKQRGVQLLQGRAVFESSDQVRLEGSDIDRIKFRHGIIATGSTPISLSGVDLSKSKRIMDSTKALKIEEIPETLLIIGGGSVALELGMIYAALGSRVTLCVRSDILLRSADHDLVKPLIRKAEAIFENILFNTIVSDIHETKEQVEVTLQDKKDSYHKTFDRVLFAIGRQPNSTGIGLENTGIRMNNQGFVVVDEHQRTTEQNIFAVGDVVGCPMFAHKAMHEGKIAAEAIAGKPAAFEAKVIPAVVYTDPQIAWCGLTENGAQMKNYPIKITRFPWSASARAATMGVHDGLTKMIFDPETKRLLGMGIVGRDAESLITEGTLAIEMGAQPEDIALTIHPHPTLSETEAEAAALFLGSTTHLFGRRT